MIRKIVAVRGFTLIEMLVVLLIISVLLLLFVPNLTKQKENAKEMGDRALIKVVETQAETYELSHDDKASLDKLVKDGGLEQSQVEGYKAYYKKHQDKKQKVAN